MLRRSSGFTAGGPAKLSSTIYLVVILLGLIVGLVVGRWWAMVVAVAAGGWIALETPVDAVPPWFLGTAYAVFIGAGIAAGVMLRRRRARR